MLSNLRKLAIVIFLSMYSANVAGQTEVDWYKSFFEGGRETQVERELDLRAQTLRTVRESADNLTEVKVLNELGLLHLTKTFDYGQAMDFLIEALKLEDSLRLSEQRVFTYVIMAKVFAEVSNFSKARELLSSALEMSSSSHPEIGPIILNELGKVDLEMGEVERGRDYFRQVIEGQSEFKADALFNIANSLSTEGKYQQALQYHKQALALYRRQKDQWGEARSLSDIGELYGRMKNLPRARANLRIALWMRRSMSDDRGLAETHNQIGVLLFQSGQYDSAIQSFNQALVAAKRAQAQNELARSYDYLSESYKSLGRYQQALQYREDFLGIRELIQGEANENRSLEAQTQYEIKQKESQINTLEADRRVSESQLAKEKQFRYFLIAFGALAMVAVAMVAFFLMREKKAAKVLEAAHRQVNIQNTELQELNATKDRFFSIISHDLKGPLNSLSSFSNLLINHTESLTKEEIQTYARDFDKSLKNLFALLENLLEWSRSQTGNIEFIPEKFDMAVMIRENKELLDGQAKQKNIELMCETPQTLFVQAHRNSINTVVRNLISNAIKFTLPGGRIDVRVQRSGKEMVVSISDTGVGMSSDVLSKLFRLDSKLSTKGTANEKGTGLGLILCKEFVEKNGGRIWVTSEEAIGSVFSFALPL